MRGLGALPGSKQRNNALLDVVNLYEEGTIMLDCPIRVTFHNEIAIDDGGVSREMYSLFWEEAIQNN